MENAENKYNEFKNMIWESCLPNCIVPISMGDIVAICILSKEDYLNQKFWSDEIQKVHKICAAVSFAYHNICINRKLISCDELDEMKRRKDIFFELGNRAYERIQLCEGFENTPTTQELYLQVETLWTNLAETKQLSER